MTDREERRRLCLERLCRETDFKERIARDPVSFPRRYSRPLDVEIAGWLASALAYGRVPLFQAAMEKILALMGGRPSEYVARFDPARDLGSFRSLYYRINRGADIACLIYLIQQVIARHGSVGTLFESCHRPEDPDVGPALERFVRRVLEIDTTPVYGSRIHPRGLAQFFSLPSKGSACKRLNLYLRWMIRPDDGLDFGLWRRVPPGKLVVPLDTHVLRIGRYLGLTRRRSAGWAAAVEITAALRRLDPEDPLRFDFPLCHLGISGRCPVGRAPDKCRVCPLLGICAKGRMLVREGIARKTKTC